MKKKERNALVFQREVSPWIEMLTLHGARVDLMNAESSLPTLESLRDDRRTSMKAQIGTG